MPNEKKFMSKIRALVLPVGGSLLHSVNTTGGYFKHCLNARGEK